MQSESRDFNEKLKQLEKIYNIKIKTKDLFIHALTHSSYTRENEISILENYERLEFLGDSVLKLHTSDILFKKFPEYPEGELTKIRSVIVSDNMLAQVSIELGLDKLLILGKKEEKSGGRKRKSIIACAFEAVLGAYYLDGKSKEIKSFLEKVFEPHIKEVNENSEKYNAKAVLQEYTQSLDKKLPVYSVVDQQGPEHDKIFTVAVSYNDDILSKGQGKTKREAEQDAAYKACVKLGAIK